MNKATVTETKDLKYQAGYVACKCGWRKELGDGFNGYHIGSCPACDPTLSIHNQRKVTTGRPVGRGLTVKLGSFDYFVLDNGIWVCDSVRLEMVRRTALRN